MTNTDDFFSNSEHTDVDTVKYQLTDLDLKNIKEIQELIKGNSLIFSLRIQMQGTVIVRNDENAEDFNINAVYINIYPTSGSIYIEAYEKHTHELITIPIKT